MTLPIHPLLKQALDLGHVVCPKCGRKMSEFDFIGEATDEDGDHIRFRCRICYPTTLPN